MSEESETGTLCVPLPSLDLVGGNDAAAGPGAAAGALSAQSAQAPGEPCLVCPSWLWGLPTSPAQEESCSRLGSYQGYQDHGRCIRKTALSSLPGVGLVAPCIDA